MKWLWIFLSIAIALGPVMWMMPSPQQKRIARLRAHAQALGLEVKIAPMPQLHRAQVRKETAEMGVVYRLRFAPNYASKHQITPWLVCRNAQTGQWEDEGLQAVPQAQREILSGLLIKLSNDIAAIEQTVMGLGVYWREHGEVDAVDKLLLDLQQLQAVSA